MNIEPTEPYVYQPDPVTSPLYPQIYGVSGPGAEKYHGNRMTKSEAENLVLDLKLSIARQ